MNKIALLNDAFRRTFAGGKVTMTAGVYALPDMVKAAALRKAAQFDEFTADNDPYGERDFGRLIETLPGTAVVPGARPDRNRPRAGIRCRRAGCRGFRLLRPPAGVSSRSRRD